MAKSDVIFKFKPVKWQYPLTDAEKRSFLIVDKPTVVNWCQENISLKAGYSSTGPVYVREWQKEPMDAMLYHSEVLFLGPTQTGKSLIADMCAYYGMVVLGIEGMVIYNNEKIAAKVFKRRIKPMVQRNSVFREIWSGRDDDLTISDIMFNNCFWGIASGQNRDDIATFPAGMVIWSELSKLPKEMSFDVFTEIQGRQGSYADSRKKIIAETTPNEVGDPMYKLVYQPGTIILEPHVPCPMCGKYIFLEDKNIKLYKSGDSEPDHDPARIVYENETACYYECDQCNGVIKEVDRPKMMESVVWAKRDYEERVDNRYVFRQEKEIINDDGTVQYDRKNMIRPCYHWNRLVDVNYKFSTCLSRFFKSRSDNQSIKTYLNNDMAKFYRPKKGAISETILSQKSQNSEYYCARGSKIPDGVITVHAGIDTQDNGFYYVFLGFGRSMECWVLRHGFIQTKIENDNMHDYKFSADLIRDVYTQEMVKHNGQYLTILNGFIDKQGHRSDCVEYISKNIQRLNCYVGNPHPDTKHAKVYNTGKGHYLGNTQDLSDDVGEMILTDLFHVPRDVTDDFIRQAVAQYHYEMVDVHDRIVRKFYSGKNDHYRDCLNMALASLKVMRLDQELFDADKCNQLIDANKKIVEQTKGNNNKKRNKAVPNRNGSYFGNGRF